jgi:hypothetical protein
MKIQRMLLLLLLPAAFFLAACVKEEPVTPNDHFRTVLVYISADNSLGRGGYDQENIEAITQGAEGNIQKGDDLLIYVDGYYSKPCLLQIKKDEGTGQMVADTVQWYDEQNSASVNVMRGVLENVFGPGSPYAGAESTGLVLWSHGSAWLPHDVQSNSDYFRAFGPDADGGKITLDGGMDLPDIQKALSGYNFDFIIFDACYMGSIEVAYALRNNTDYFVASPTEIMGSGMPYQSIVKYFFSKNDMAQNMSQVASTFYTYYKDNEDGSNYPSATVALVRSSQLAALASATKPILAGHDDDIFALDASSIQCLEYLQGVSPHVLYDFADYVKHLASESQYTAFQNALNAAVPYKASTENAYFGNRGWVSIDSTRFCGLSTYLPRSTTPKLNDWYKQLDWYQAVYQ